MRVKGGKSFFCYLFFHVTVADKVCHTLRGGVEHDFSLRSTTATFVYLTHFAVVIHFETALPRPRGAC